MSNDSEVSRNIADLVTIQTFLDQAAVVPAYVREALTRLGGRATTEAMRKDIIALTSERTPRTHEAFDQVLKTISGARRHSRYSDASHGE